MELLDVNKEPSTNTGKNNLIKRGFKKIYRLSAKDKVSFFYGLKNGYTHYNKDINSI